MPEAQVSLRHLRVLLQAIDALAPADAKRARAALGRHQLEEIERGDGSWRPAGLIVSWMEALDKTLGRRSFVNTFVNFAKFETKDSVLKSFVSGALRMFGTGGGSTLARRIPSGMSLMYRDVGTISDMRVSDSEHHIIIDDMAAPCSDSPSYVHGVAAYFQGLFEAFGIKGAVSVAEHDRAARRVVFRCTWT